MQVADTGIFENLKEKMTNPLIFTYFWVFCSWNIKNIFYLFYMPLKIDQKFIELEGEWWVFMPILMTPMMVFLLPWVNNLVELGRQKAHQWLQDTLHHLGWKPMIDSDTHQKVVNDLSTTKQFLYETRVNLNDLREQLRTTNEDIANEHIKLGAEAAEAAEMEAAKKQIENNTQVDIQASLKSKLKFEPIGIWPSFEVDSFKSIGDKALLLLKEASQDASALIFATSTDDGYSIDTNGKSLTLNENVEGIIKWKEVLSELANLGFINPRTQDSYELTTKGFEYSKQISFNDDMFALIA
jgi:hypothetical protein